MLTRIIDVRAIAKAVRRAREISKSRIILVVKANAYGVGFEAVQEVKSLVDGFAVARAIEGARMRRLGFSEDILVLSYDDTQLKLTLDNGLIPSVSYTQQLSLLEECGAERCHIAVDTGMSRHGIKGLDSLSRMVNTAKTVQISGLFTHIFNNNMANIHHQAKIFDIYRDSLKSSINNSFVSHVSATGAIETLSGRYDAVRLGIGAYRDVNYIVSNVIGLKRVLKGESIGYDGAFIASKDMTVAIVEGGYADGIPRRFSGHKILINSDFCRVIGNICMDVIMVDVTDTRCKIGDRAVFLDNDLITLQDLSADTGRIEYETLTAFQGRINRVIFK